jgi:hypothetical protein
MASGILVVQGPRGARKALVVDEAYFGVLLVVSAWLVDVGVTSRLEDRGGNGVVECSGYRKGLFKFWLSSDVDDG